MHKIAALLLPQRLAPACFGANMQKIAAPSCTPRAELKYAPANLRWLGIHRGLSWNKLQPARQLRSGNGRDWNLTEGWAEIRSSQPPMPEG